MSSEGSICEDGAQSTCMLVDEMVYFGWRLMEQDVFLSGQESKFVTSGLFASEFDLTTATTIDDDDPLPTQTLNLMRHDIRPT
jgi:hypothetical protein